MGLVFYKESSTGKIVCDSRDAFYSENACRALAKSVFTDKRFGVFWVGEFSCFKYHLMNHSHVEALQFAREQLPNEIKLQLLLLGESQ